MRNTLFAALAAVGLLSALPATARAQYYVPGPGTTWDIPGPLFARYNYGTRVWGPGFTYSYPYMYQSNNPSSFAPGYYNYGPGYFNYYYPPPYTTTYYYRFYR